MDRKLMTVKIEAGNESSTGIYIKCKQSKDIILTTFHGLEGTEDKNVKVTYFFKNELIPLEVDLILRNKENDIAIIRLKENSLRREEIPNVFFFDRVSEGEEFQLQGFPISLEEEIDPLQILKVIINIKDYNDIYHEIRFESNYEDNITPDGTSGFSGGAIYKYVQDCILLSGIYLGVRSEESIYKTGRMLKLKNIICFFEENRILIDSRNTYMINLIFDKVEKTINDQKEVLSLKLIKDYLDKLKRLKTFFLNNEEIFISLIQRMTCNSISDLIYFYDSYKENIIEFIYGILAVEEELKILDILEYKEKKYSLFNPISESEKNFVVVLKKVLSFLNDRDEESINNFIRFNVTRSKCAKICPIEKENLGEINTDLLTNGNIEKENFLYIKSEKNMKFICAGCFANLESLEDRGKELWEK